MFTIRSSVNVVVAFIVLRATFCLIHWTFYTLIPTGDICFNFELLQDNRYGINERFRVAILHGCQATQYITNLLQCQILQ